MKNTTLRRALALLLILVLALSLAACGGQASDSTSQGSSGKLNTPKKNDSPESGTTESSEDPVTSQDESVTFTFSDQAQAALDDLCAHRQQEYFAAAVLGDREKGDTSSFSSWLNDTNPFMASIWPFLTEIPEEDIFGEYGELYCIVPLVESAKVTVKSLEWETLGNGSTADDSDPLYYGEVGKPFLMYVNYNDIWESEPDLIVEYVQDDGFVASWFPKQEAGYIYRPYTYGHDNLMDFSLLYDVGDYIPYLDDSPDADSEWLPPTELLLADTTWYSDNGWMMVLAYDYENSSGGMVLYQPVTDADGTNMVRYCHGVWWMEDDSLYLDAYNDRGEMVGGLFPVLMSPSSGEELIIMQADDGTVPPFFEEGQTQAVLTFTT